LGGCAFFWTRLAWRDFGQPGVWLRLATGKSILGALLGAYASVELAKRWVGYRSVTGDWFALIAPLGIIVDHADLPRRDSRVKEA
jgi:phosphatidylglycerol---prolipoprotein diacylglyceryl transferase